MAHLFDIGYSNEPFTSLCADYPGPEVCSPSQFRVEWGPIFHRGRLDGSARVAIIGQDPAQNESIVRRILVGEAGRRLQGFLGKLGITTSYVLINTFLYSVYGHVKASTRKQPELIAYRHRWMDALLINSKVEAVLALGTLADEAWQMWKATPQGRTVHVAYARATHPTQPESSSKGDRVKLKAATAAMLKNWNQALDLLRTAIAHPDTPRPLALYGESFQPGDKADVPEIDLPAGLPPWMREDDNWARRVGGDELAKRRNITVTVPKGVFAS